MSLYEDARLEIALAKRGVFVLNQSRLGQAMLGVSTKVNNLFVLGKSRLDQATLGDTGDDANTEWRSLMADSQSISIQRGGQLSSTPLPQLQPGTLSANLVGPRFDPRMNALVKPGAPLRLITAGGQVVWTGNLLTARPSYGVKDKSTTVKITGVDRVTELSKTKRAGIVAGTFGQRITDLLEKKGIPYSVFGGTAELAANNYDSSLLNHLQVAADSEHGYFFITRENKVYVYGHGTTPVDSGLVLSDKDSNPGIKEILPEWADDFYNTVTVKNLTREYNESNEPVSVETTYGPYTSDTSIATWGTASTELTTNLTTQAAITGLASKIVTNFDAPYLTVKSVTFNTTSNVDLAAGLELFQLVTVQFDDGSVVINEQYQVMSMKHDLVSSSGGRRESWLVTLGLYKFEGRSNN